MWITDFDSLAVLNRDQLHRRGVSDKALRTALADGSLHRLKRGWYTAHKPAVGAARHALLVRVQLIDHPGTLASHYSAAVQLGYPVHRVPWGQVQLMRVTPGRGRHSATLVVHEQVGGVTQLSASLAIAQTALLCPISGLMALDHALRSEAVEPHEVLSWAKLLRGHRGRPRVDLVCALGDGRRESPLESRTAFTFHGWGLCLDPQFEVAGTDYRTDFRLRGTKVLVECDGTGKYDEPGSQLREKVREDAIRTLGWEMVRVTTALLDDPAELVRRVRAAIDRAARGGGPTTGSGQVHPRVGAPSAVWR